MFPLKQWWWINPLVRELSALRKSWTVSCRRTTPSPSRPTTVGRDQMEQMQKNPTSKSGWAGLRGSFGSKFVVIYGIIESKSEPSVQAGRLSMGPLWLIWSNLPSRVIIVIKRAAKWTWAAWTPLHICILGGTALSLDVSEFTSENQVGIDAGKLLICLKSVWSW